MTDSREKLGPNEESSDKLTEGLQSGDVRAADYSDFVRKRVALSNQLDRAADEERWSDDGLSPLTRFLLANADYIQ